MSLVVAQMMAREDLVHYSEPQDVLLIMNTLTELGEIDMLKAACDGDITQAIENGVTLNRKARTTLIGSVLCGKFSAVTELGKKISDLANNRGLDIQPT